MKRQLAFILFVGLFVASVFLSTLIVSGCGGGGGGGGGGFLPPTTAPLATGTFIKTPSYTDQNNNVFPFTDNNASQILQQLYLASEVNGAGYINKISFRLGPDLGAPVDCPNCTVKLGHTSLANLTDTFATNVEQGRGSQITVINNATITIPAGSSGEYFDIPLDTPFHYNGVDNLVFEISRTSPCSGDVKIDVDDMGAASFRQVNAQPIAATGLQSDWQRLTKFHFAGGDNEQNFGGASNVIWPFASVAPRTQNLYLASEIDGSGPITGLAFQMNAVSTAQTYTSTVTMGHTTLAALGTTYADNYDAGAPVTVANAVTFNIPAGISAGEWFWVPLPDSTFTYNGTDNLIVDVVMTAGSGNTNLRFTSIAGRRAFNVDNTDPVAVNVDGVAVHIKLRFNGGTIMVMPIGNSSAGVLGVVDPGGQIQSLYRNSDLGTAATINSVSVRLEYDSVATTLTNYKLYMGHTTKTAFNIADTYASNMDDSALVYSGTLEVPAGLKEGDWLTIPLQTYFNYDVTRNLSILFTTDMGSVGDNYVRASLDVTRYFNHSVGRDDNAVGINGNPTLDGDGIVDLQIGITK